MGCVCSKRYREDDEPAPRPVSPSSPVVRSPSPETTVAGPDGALEVELEAVVVGPAPVAPRERTPSEKLRNLRRLCGFSSEPTPEPVPVKPEFVGPLQDPRRWCISSTESALEEVIRRRTHPINWGARRDLNPFVKKASPAAGRGSRARGSSQSN
ncbi:hypothetical protein HRR83_007907 [Exophiala dermatitidis]|uniref:Uncharacterized protein n=2 Tax=Exophiala dermatitidis TaxID=5970 RepID=H6BUF0_EXODN|nr:uncharacterized protein HMPREF1120_03817 [Exophiala dermatitidis NIH/UT8656]KAJ4506577.1 hypothetical protein HRR75_006819 [Exophiala dermatitidis]EHY55692.1 hypothetical protein HMPREF1120_03817 [Exophiala dermatitidis NIH/UT8656]KAJ4508846.1 hypothetical protein HRR74_007438 [Exophiala dermatitidis]KAJ4510098.1 hypothetical protein HRR73_006896 [Exophiala dermatitidis]KAJ4539101.1 hypothetical protein HRR77_006517 [Exophiala dermatitidis]